jgi:hypothetical protein
MVIKVYEITIRHKIANCEIKIRAEGKTEKSALYHSKGFIRENYPNYEVVHIEETENDKRD